MKLVVVPARLKIHLLFVKLVEKDSRRKGIWITISNILMAKDVMCAKLVIKDFKGILNYELI